MSEFQYVAFRAIDKPVTQKNLEFMGRQSSRAKITPWSFENEYNFGDFHGNAEEMLRRGYDVHLHYANFGIRKLMIQFPYGLPNAKAAKPFFVEDSLSFIKDKHGPGGIVCIAPYYEPGDLEDLWDLSELLDRLIALRAELLDGDLRPLYLAYLAVACDGNHDPGETKEAPVPAGLNELSDAQQALAELYGLSKSLVVAAAQNTPPLPACEDSQSHLADWLRLQPEATKNAWLAQWLATPHSAARNEILAEFQKAQNTPTWPTVHLNRTIAELQAAAEEVQEKANRQAADKAARQHAKRLAAMLADPAATLHKCEQLVKNRSTHAYHEIATLLSDLREALAGSVQADLPEQQARKLKAENPTLKLLTSELRRQGFLQK